MPGSSLSRHFYLGKPLKEILLDSRRRTNDINLFTPLPVKRGARGKVGVFLACPTDLDDQNYPHVFCMSECLHKVACLYIFMQTYVRSNLCKQACLCSLCMYVSCVCMHVYDMHVRM